MMKKIPCLFMNLSGGDLMQQFYLDYLERLQRLHEDAKSALTGLDARALERKPGPDMNSLSVLVVHIAGAERFWIGDVAMNDPSNRDRESEFQAVGLNSDELAQRLDASLSYIRQGLEGLALPDLEQARTAPDSRQVTVGWCLEHTLAHTATHIGQMQLTRQFLALKG
jgi:uncharacterized damage-inducible protein DinB